jgi:hypothetical protein
MAAIRNIHGQGVNRDGEAAGEIYVDFGEITDGRFVKFAVMTGKDGSVIALDIRGEMCDYSNDAPSLRILINGVKALDTSEGGPRPIEDPLAGV